MCNMIFINNLNFNYNTKNIFKNFSLCIEKNSFTTILGNNGSGKSTLVRLLTGLEDSNGSITIDGLLLCDYNINDIRKIIGVVFENPDNCLISETVLEDMAFPLENLNYSSDYIYSKIDEISEYLGISDLLDKNPHCLSGGEKQLVSLGCALITSPKLLILDEAFSMLDDISKHNMLKLLKKIQNDFGMTIINITHDIEESIYSDNIVLIDHGKLIISDTKESVYGKEKELRKAGFNLPFMVDLSNRLSYYGLVDKIIYNMDEMVDLLWK